MASRPRPRTRLEVERLEARDLMAGIRVSGSILYITGSARDDKAFVTYPPTRTRPSDAWLQNRFRVTLYTDGQLVQRYGRKDDAGPIRKIVFFGYGGNDSFSINNPSREVLTVEAYGHNGHDTLSGGRGNDKLDGGIGHDKLYGGAGNDTLRGGAGLDTLNGDAGNDKLFGDADADFLYGGDGTDVLDGGAGNDLLQGQAGSDLLYGQAGRDTLYGGAGRDYLNGGADGDVLAGGGAIVVNGSYRRVNDGAADTLFGGTGADSFFAEPYFDTTLDIPWNRDLPRDFRRGIDAVQ